MIELGLIFAISTAALSFAAFLARWVHSRPLGDAATQRVADLVREAAEGFERRQGSTIGALSAVFGGAVFLAYGLLRTGGVDEPLPALEVGVWLTASFAVGAASSVFVGRVATWIATRANVRAAAGARLSLDLALTISIRAGAVSALVNVSAGLLGLAGLFAAAFAYQGGFGPSPGAALALVPTLPLLVAGYALGASFAALLAQLGGGTFSKSADLGADIAGKEAGLGDDDAQNPATIADLAGDNVGDCAGRAAGTFQSTVAETLGAMILGAAVFRANAHVPSVLSLALFPLVARAFGVLGAIFGVMVVKTDDREDPVVALVRGLYVTALLYLAGVAGAAKWLLGEHWPRFLACGALGIAASLAFFHVCQYYTECKFRPVRELSEVARGGPALAILGGIAAGLESTVLPLVVIVTLTLGSYEIGVSTGLAGGGLFGMAVATVGVLGMAPYVLAMDAFGAIVDNAAGLVEMTVAGERPDVRGRTLVLDGVGTTTKSFTRVYAAGSAAIGSLLLVSVFLDEALRRVTPGAGREVADLQKSGSPVVYLGALTGIVLVFWFAARCVSAVTRASRRLVDEVRRQLGDRSYAGGESPRSTPPARSAGVHSRTGFVPDHTACVDLLSRSALRQMIAPAIVAAAVPIVVGLGLRFAKTEDNPLLAANSVAALVMAGTIAGVLGSLLLGNAGGTWDNAKQYIVTGAHGGRSLVDETGVRVDNPVFSAAAVGDTVGDPLKDAAGPAIHVLVKMLSVIALVFLPFFI
jgi:K(+)-stimulated pyrophosphate-energized sodium pump